MKKEIDETCTLIGITDSISDIDDALLAEFLENKNGYAKVSDNRLALATPCTYVESSLYFYYKNGHIETIESSWDSIPQLREILTSLKVKSKLDSFISNNGFCISVDICSKEEGKLYYYDKENDEWFLLGKTKTLLERLDKITDFMQFDEEIRHYRRFANMLTVIGSVLLVVGTILRHYSTKYSSFAFALLLLSMFCCLTSTYINAVKIKKLRRRK